MYSVYLSKATCDALRKMKLKAIIKGLGTDSDEHKEALLAGQWLYFSTAHAGTARISIIGDCQMSPRRWSPGFVACQFDDPRTAAEQGLDCNPYSGKWNFHHDDVQGVLSMETALRLLRPGNVRLEK